MMFNVALTEDRFRPSRRAAIGMFAGALMSVMSGGLGIQPGWAQPGQLPQQIYIIRHGEKPIDESKPPFGVDIDGNRNPSSLSPKGWERAGALTALFSPAVAPKLGLRSPTALYATAYGDAAVTKIHRPYQTLLGLSKRLGLPIQSPVLLGQEAAFADAVLSSGAEVVLISYEHHRIPALLHGFPTTDGSAIPPAWPDDRYDVIWTLTLDPVAGHYVFGQVPQQLLDGDTDTVI
jgi:broad specificity phosphatase PhoE